jgi:opacity protein-like surface antigen
MNRLALILCLSLCSSMAYAGNVSVDLLLGTTKQESQIKEYDMDFSDNNSSYGLRGAYDFNKYLGMELFYLKNSELKDSHTRRITDKFDAEINTSSIGIGVKGIFPFDMGLNLIARLGIGQWDYKYKHQLDGDTFKSDDSGNDLYYGQFAITKSILLGVEYLGTDYSCKLFDNEFELDHGTDSLLFSANYRF